MREREKDRERERERERAVAQSVERPTLDEEVLGSFPALAARSPLAVSVSV